MFTDQIRKCICIVSDLTQDGFFTDSAFKQKAVRLSLKKMDLGWMYCSSSKFLVVLPLSYLGRDWGDGHVEKWALTYVT